MTTLDIIRKTKAAWSVLRDADAETKNRLLTAMADSLVDHTAEVLACNETDLEAARGHISDVMLDRLRLDEGRIAAMAEGIRVTVKLPDHTGRILSETHHANGMTIYKKQVPLGLVAIIYESRPNVTSDAAALTVKSGNVCVLRSGKEAVRTSTAIVKALKQGISAVGGDPDIVNILEDTSHESARVLMTADGLVDLLIPRGGAGLIQACVEQATVPCIQTGTGICHVYVDEYADLDKAVKIIVNAKTSRPSVCNAEEVCLVHSAVAERFLPMLRKVLVEDRTAAGQIHVELRLDPRAAAVIPGTPAGPADFDTEFLDYILAVRVVDSVDEAIEHIQAHSTHHSEAIVTENDANAEKFVNGVDSAAVYVNVSTRFTDGGEFGLGCEMGISTQKLHARGPMGLDELSTYQYIIRAADRPGKERRMAYQYEAGFIGAGNMGGALARAAVKTVGGAAVAVACSTAEHSAKAAASIGCAAETAEAILRKSRFVFWGVKPQMFAGVTAKLAEDIAASDAVFVSMLAGVSLDRLAEMLGGEKKIIRIMPNTPSAVGQGLMLVSANDRVTAEELAAFKALMAESGLLDDLPENLIDAASAVSGCGPAYAYMFVEALADGAVKCGVPRAKAMRYAAQMLLGSASLLLETGEHPGALKDAVCSPGGSTIAGVAALEDRGFRGAAIAAVEAAYRRTKELG